MDHHNDSNTNLLLMVFTFVLSVMSHFISEIDLYLGVFAKIISIISFFLVLFLNWGKIKERISEVKKMFRK